MTKQNDKQSFVAGYLEAQTKYREAHRLWRDHRRLVEAGEVTPEYVKSLEPFLGQTPYEWEHVAFADEFEASAWYGSLIGHYDPIGEALRYQGWKLLEEKGFMYQAEAAWADAPWVEKQHVDYDQVL